MLKAALAAMSVLTLSAGALTALPAEAAPKKAAAKRYPQIPDAFRGNWDGSNMCDMDSDMQMHIAARTIQFYEDHGNVLAVRQISPTEIRLTLSVHYGGGEGPVTQTDTLQLVDGGRQLIYGRGGTEASPRSYQRCSRMNRQ